MLNLLVTLYTDRYQNDETDLNRTSLRNITWSPYDRITFKSADSLKDLYYDNDNNAWRGIKQCMRLVEESFDENAISNKWTIVNVPEDKIIEITDSENKAISYSFHLIYAVRFNDEIQRLRQKKSDKISEDFDKKIIREEINSIINKVTRNRDVEYKCFRSLGSEDMVVIFLANSMKTLAEIIPYLNQIQIKEEDISLGKTSTNPDKTIDLFSTVCTFSGVNCVKSLGKIDVDIILHLNMKTSDPLTYINKVNLIEGIQHDSWQVLCGKRMLKLYIHANSIDYSNFLEKGIFNGTSQEYKENVYSSITFFVLSDINENSIYREFKKSPVIEILPTIKENLIYKKTNENNDIQESYENNEKDVDENNTEKPSPVAEFLFGEYERLILSKRAVQWSDILKKQYNSMKKFANYYCNFDKYQENEMLSNLQSSLHLINQACSAASEIPNHNHFYVGSFHDILKAYYHLIDKLFDLGKRLPHGEETTQHEITFAICLNPTAVIESRLYTRDDQTDRFVIFSLPYDQFWNYSENIKKLVHEVFHYIAPYDRETRAENLLRIIYSLVLRKRITQLMLICGQRRKIQSANNLMIDGKNRIKPWVNFLLQKYDINFKASLLKKIKKYYPLFSVVSIPEWVTFFITNKYIINVIRIVSDQVNNNIISFFDQSMEYIDCMISRENVLNKDTSFDKDFTPAKELFGDKDDVAIILNQTDDSPEGYFINKFMKIDPDYPENITIYTSIEHLIHNYIMSAKEAFCDLWAIKLTGDTIPQYIVTIFEQYKNIRKEEEVLASFKLDKKGKYKFEGSVDAIRMSLLLHYYFINSVNKIPCTLSEVKSAFHKIHYEVENKKYIRKCINLICKIYHTFIRQYGKIEIISLYNMAFNGVNEITDVIADYDFFGIVSAMKTISKTNSSKSVNIDDLDLLSNTYAQINPAPQTTKKVLLPKQLISPDLVNFSNPYASTIGIYISIIENIMEIISPNSQSGHKLWYRGVCSDEFSLLPSIFRHLDSNLSIYTNQVNAVQRAYFSSLYASEIWNLPIEQRMAMLQHYGVPTNLLDFSIDPMVALHFALNPDIPQDRIKIDSGIYQPIIYAFDPISYGVAIRKMEEWNKDSQPPLSISSVRFDINKNKNDIPCLFIEDMSYDFLYNHSQTHTSGYAPNDRGDDFPVPIVIQQSNPRIAAQSGTFVAYSLDTRPEIGKVKDVFNYIDLLNIQNRYLKFLGERAKLTDRFLFPIFIDKNYISQLRTELKYLNINTGKYYPELSKIFQDAMKDF